MKRVKKGLAAIMTLCMLLSLIPTAAFAEELKQPAEEITAPVEETTGPMDESPAPSGEVPDPSEKPEVPADGTGALQPADSGATASEADEGNMVAQVGDASYTAIEEAFKNANNGQTVTLLKNTAVEEQLVVEKGQTVVLDLNGKILTEEKPLIVEGKLTVQDSTAMSEPTVEENKNVTYDAGKIQNTCDTRSDDAIVIQVRNGGTLIHVLWSRTTILRSPSSEKSKRQTGKLRFPPPPRLTAAIR